ncbi:MULTISPECIES: proline reductase-associated electron transfer protein PrdC [Gemella]|uniref:proline reductase-associated electron transfer protein PrdC n=1 Tax=Gemella TaxID=1378 RepID=UPI00076833BE|nr:MULTISPECIES: proline reductase-associated electron transfer protein PrdC [Gemella]AME10003.1 proline reductase-associated electron transfer protein PrdC [Gemella sp. oral taxon 928]AXI26141.1 proline reductase-associated electron transfer protein PrdC [Gemella sp. ND 6198]
MEYIFPLKQHVGAPSEVIVEKNSTVARGEMIAKKPDAALGSNIFSSVSGIVTDVTEEKIVIEEKDTDFSTYKPLTSTTPEDLIAESGLVGLGGAGFPTAVKLGIRFENGTGTVIVNAAECEPILSHNIARIEDKPENLLKGLRIVMNIVNAKKGIIALKGIHSEAVQILKSAVQDDDITIFELENIYPMGEERAIIRESLGVLLKPDKLPSEADAVVINVETVLKVREIVEEKKPLIDKDLTVAGKLTDAGSIHVLFDVPLGSSVGSLFDKCGGLDKEYGELIMGGPFTGKRTYVEAPIVKTTGGLIAAEKFLPSPEKIGVLVCACGANEERLREQAASMNSEVVGVEFCKNAMLMKNGTRKCLNPGICPGQVQKVMSLKKAGAQAVLISNCTDCTNTVMSCAPQLKLPVYHCTDGALRSVNYKLIRKFKN